MASCKILARVEGWRTNEKIASWLVMIGGGAVALSSSLTWMSWITSARPVIPSARPLVVTSNGGSMVLMMGLLIACIGFIRLIRPSMGRSLEGFAFVFVVAGLVGTMVDYQSLSSIANYHGAGAYWNADPGYWLCLIGLAAALFGATRWRRLRSPDAISAISIREPWEISRKGL